MMDSKELYRNLSLAEVEFLTPLVLNLLSRYNIFTLGQLLSSTWGLTKIEVFNDLNNKDVIINELIQFIPEDVLNEYKEFSEEHPTGLKIIPNNEKDSENIK
jgi:hypothetical protein